MQRKTLLAVAAVTITAAIGVGVGVGEAFGGTSTHPAPDKSTASLPTTGLGALPAYLPKDTTKTDATIRGTVAHPALTSEGDEIRAVLPRRGSAHSRPGPSVLVKVVGPATPGEGLPFQAQADTATWRVTMSKATGTVPVDPSTFTAIDSLGKVYSPYLVPGQPKPPRFVKPGQTVSFELRVAMRVGEGDMRWAPVDNDLLGTWDFVVEND